MLFYFNLKFMNFNQPSKANNFKQNYLILKKGVTSGGSRSIFFIKNKLPLQIIIKNLIYSRVSKSGRNTSGQKVLRTRKSLKKKNSSFSINYSFRSLYIGFIASIVMVPFSNKLISLLFLSSGSVSYVPSTINHRLFLMTRFYSSLIKLKKRKNSLFVPSGFSDIKSIFHILKDLPRNVPISLIELTPGKGVQYVRSSGTSAKMSKRDWRLNIGLLKLPSGVKKVFSTFSLASLGSVALPEKKMLKNTKAGFYKNFGRNSIVRGVAMNPVDHPHGGRTKSIKYPRTPWGKTTKYK